MTVLFKTHETGYIQSSNPIRFSFKWESVTGGASECGSELKGNHGTVTSPGYPSNYPHDSQCTWSISLGDDAQDTDHIVLSFKVKKKLEMFRRDLSRTSIPELILNFQQPTSTKIKPIFRISKSKIKTHASTISWRSITLQKRTKI